MRTRQALRDLQERLALRLRNEGAPSAQACWLAVQAGGCGYLLPLAQAGEIFPCAPAHVVPYTQPWFLGVVHLRGGLWAAVDLAAWVAQAAHTLQRADARPAQSPDRLDARLVTLHPSIDVNSALRVDRLAGLRAPEDFPDQAAAPEGAPAWYAQRYADARGETWQALDLQALAQDPAFLTLADGASRPTPNPLSSPELP